MRFARRNKEQVENIRNNNCGEKQSIPDKFFNFIDSIFKHEDNCNNPFCNHQTNNNVHNTKNNKNKETSELSDDLSEWIIVYDDSSEAGRQGKAELLVDFPNEEEEEEAENDYVNNHHLFYGSNNRNSSSIPPIILTEREFEMNNLPLSPFPTSPRSSSSSLLSLSSSSSNLSAKYESRRRSPSRLSCNPPKQFLCPITKQLMKQPVVASDGHSYEHASISKWLDGYIRSPMTGKDMSSKLLIPNFTLKSLIDEWRIAHPYYED